MTNIIQIKKLLRIEFKKLLDEFAPKVFCSLQYSDTMLNAAGVAKCNFNSHLKTYNYSITISIPFLKIRTLQENINTLRHEFAHILDYVERGFSNHDEHWQSLAIKVGASPNACFKLSEKQNDTFTLVKYKYVLYCPQNCIIHIIFNKQI